MTTIGVDYITPGGAIGKTLGGMHVYFRALLPRLAAAAPDSRFAVFAGRGRLPAGIAGSANVRCVRCPRVPAGRIARVLYEHSAYARVIEREGVDLFVGMCNVLPLGLRRPAVVVIQSLQYFTHPETYSPLRGAYLRWIVPHAVRRAARVICVSETARRDLIAFTGARPEKVAVVHHGVAPAFAPQGGPGGCPETRGAPYVLAISALYGFKNFARTVRAFARARRAAALPHKLLIVGSDADVTRGDLARVAQAEGVGDAVIVLGGLPHERVPALYARADLLALPSLYETFGQPLVEAMASGCPVLTSDASCMPEITAGAAELVDPLDVGAIADGMLRVLTDPARARALREAGLARARVFDWERTARRTLAVLREALDCGARIADPAARAVA